MKNQKQTPNRKEQERRRVSAMGSILLWIGVALLFISVVHMIVQIESADRFATMWVFSVVTGVLLIFIGVLLGWAARNRY